MAHRVDVRRIVQTWLLEHEYDGLYDCDECGCAIDDLMWCEGTGNQHCEPAYKASCDFGDGCAYQMVATKPE